MIVGMVEMEALEDHRVVINSGVVVTLDVEEVVEEEVVAIPEDEEDVAQMIVLEVARDAEEVEVEALVGVDVGVVVTSPVLRNMEGSLSSQEKRLPLIRE